MSVAIVFRQVCAVSTILAIACGPSTAPPGSADDSSTSTPSQGATSDDPVPGTGSSTTTTTTDGTTVGLDTGESTDGTTGTTTCGSFICKPEPCDGRFCEPRAGVPPSCGPSPDGPGLFFALEDDPMEWERLWLDPRACVVMTVPGDGRNLTLLCAEKAGPVTVTVTGIGNQAEGIPWLPDQAVDVRMHLATGIDSWVEQAIVVHDAATGNLLLALYYGPSDLPLDAMAPVDLALGTSACTFDSGEIFCSDAMCCGADPACQATRFAGTFSLDADSIELWSQSTGSLPGFDIVVADLVSYNTPDPTGYVFGVFATP